MLNFLQSNELNEFAPAFVAASSEMGNAIKDKVNPHFKNAYATLGSVREATRPVLAKHGLALLQTLVHADSGAVLLRTTLLHKSGQWIAGEQLLNPVKNDPQGLGSAISYARRYGEAAICGIVAEEDDDGNAASEAPRKAKAAPAPKAEPQGPDEPSDRPPRLQELMGMCEKAQEGTDLQIIREMAKGLNKADQGRLAEHYNAAKARIGGVK
jgi:hypothetical protein